MPPVRSTILVFSALLALAGCAEEPPWNVLLVTLDTTRADHLGCYGNDTIATPHVDALAASGVRFARAYSPLPITLPAHTSILTGLYPNAHGVRDNGLFVVTPEQETLAEMLRARGYRTAAAIGGFPLVAKFGIDQGFEHFDDRLSGTYEDLRDRRNVPRGRLFFEQRRAARVNEALFPWLDSHGDEPFFVWAHYYDPHQPFEPPTPYDQLYANDLYDGEIAYADESFGSLLAKIESLGVLDRTVVVLTSDHGEGLGDHGEITHSFLIYNATLHVPLIIRWPGAPEKVVPTRVRTVDIVPTVLDLLGLEVPSDLHGRSLIGLVQDDSDAAPDRPHDVANAADRPHYAETLSPRLANGWGELRAFFDGRWKYIHGPRPQLFDLEADPRELDDRVDDEPEEAERMKGRLEAFLARESRSQEAAAVGVDEETRARLAALGYLQGGGASPATIREELREDGIAPRDRVADVNAISTAKELIFRGQALGAKEILAGLLAEDPDNRYYREALAYAEFQLGHLEAALVGLEPLLEPGNATAGSQSLLRDIGRWLYLSGQREEGLRRVRQSLDPEPSAAGLYLLSTLLADLGRIDEARKVVEETLALDPTHGPALVDRAIRLAEAGEPNGAEAAFGHALAEHPYFGKAQFNYGAFLVEQGRIAEAVGPFERAVDLDPSYDQAYAAAVAVHLHLGNRSRAEHWLEAFERALPASPGLDAARRLVAGAGP